MANFNGNSVASTEYMTTNGLLWAGNCIFESVDLDLKSGYTPATGDVITLNTLTDKHQRYDGAFAAVVDESITLAASAGQTTNVVNVVIKKVTDSPETTTYVEGTDYTFDKNGNITALGGGSIGATDTILVSYDYEGASQKMVGVLTKYDTTTLENLVITETAGGFVNVDELGYDNAATSALVDVLRDELNRDDIATTN